MSTDPLWDSSQVRALVASRDPGGLIRVGREARSWRQPDLGIRIGCSASTVSRLEKRGDRGELALVRAAAREVDMPTAVLAASLGLSALPATTAAPEGPQPQEDPMRRRTMLAAAGLAGPTHLLLGVDEALANMPSPTGSPIPLDSRLAAARSLFDNGRHAALHKEQGSPG